MISGSVTNRPTWPSRDTLGMVDLRVRGGSAGLPGRRPRLRAGDDVEQVVDVLGKSVTAPRDVVIGADDGRLRPVELPERGDVRFADGEDVERNPPGLRASVHVAG